MAKLKRAGFGRVVRAGQEGYDLWEVDGVEFRWQRGYGLNLWCRVRPEDAWQPLVWVASLKEAGLFAEGLAAGLAAGRPK